MSLLPYTLYLVTGRYTFDEEAFLKRVIEACENGVTMVQLREKDITAADYFKLAQKVKAITDRYHLPLIIDDRVDICLAVDASGVHIGDEDLPVDIVRQLLGPTKLIGVSAKTVDRAVEAERLGADYLGTGAIFPTKTKDKAPLTSLETLAAICEAVAIPVVAIGGIKEHNIKTFAGSKIAGLAIVSDIMTAADVAQKTNKIRSQIDQVIGRSETDDIESK